MTAVRFLYTSQPGKGFEELTSPDLQLKNWLIDNLRVPSSPSNRSLSRGLGVTVQDDLVICTYLNSELDDNKRRFIRSHSALFTEPEYNRWAREFDRYILAQLEKTDEEILEDDLLKPLGIPDNPRNGLSQAELETLVSYRGWDLKQVLATLIDGKHFTVHVKGSQEESIALAVTLLKIAALGNLPVPQLSTFEPNGKVRAWYPSQVSFQSQARVDIQFQARGAPGREAADQAERLARAIENLDPDGIAAAMESGRNHEEVRRRESRGKENARTEREGRKPDAPPPRNQKGGIYEVNKKFEAKLKSIKTQLDDREKELNQRAQDIAARERNVTLREKDVSDAEAHINDRKEQLRHWSHIYEIFSVIDKEDSLKLEERVLDRLLNDIKSLRPEVLITLKQGITEFIPKLEETANRHESRRGRFQGDIKEIERKLERSVQPRK